MNWRELLGFPPRIQDLARRLLGVARERGETDWEYDEASHALRNSSGHTVNLANLFLEYRNAPRSGRAALIAKYSSIMGGRVREMPKLWQLAAKSVYPVVRSIYDMTAIEIQSRNGKTPLHRSVTWPLAGDLWIRLVYDHGASLAHVMEDIADVWGQSRDALRQRALDNLRALERPQWIELADGVHQVTSAVSFEESFFLLDAVIDKLPFAASVVVMPTNRGVLLAADSTSQDAVLALLAEAHRSLVENPWPMSVTMLHRSDGAWREFVPTGLALERWRAMQQINLAGVYNDQQALLQEHLGDDVFVGTFGLLQKADGLEHVRSWCTWTKGVTTLMPRAELVVFGKEGEESREMLIVAWDHAVSVCGERVQPTSEHPPRFRVDSFPDETQWQRLLAVGELRHVDEQAQEE